MGEIKYYAVQAGHHPGVYTSWKDCMDQIRAFKGAKFKSFTTAEDAELYMAGKDPSLDPTSSCYTAKFYGVKSGKVPGVYTDWASAEEQVKGVSKPKVKCFSTRHEAEAFVSSGPIVAKPIESPTKTQPQKLVEPRSENSPPLLEDDDDDDDDDVEILSSTPSIFEPGPHHTDEDPASKKQKTGNLSEREPNSTPAPHDATLPLEKKRASRNSQVLRIYTDGSALANGQNGAQAGIGVWFGEQDSRNISEPLAGPRQTNQRAELTAMLRGLGMAPLHRDVLIYTDSQYSIKCVTVWHTAWIRNNWITSVGRPVENRDLVEQIINLIRERETTHGSYTKFEWVKGHTGLNDGNSMADRLAVQGARMPRNLL